MLISGSGVANDLDFGFQLQPTGAAGAGAIEHDPCSLYKVHSQVLNYHYWKTLLDNAVNF